MNIENSSSFAGKFTDPVGCGDCEKEAKTNLSVKPELTKVTELIKPTDNPEDPSSLWKTRLSYCLLQDYILFKK